MKVNVNTILQSRESVVKFEETGTSRGYEGGIQCFELEGTVEGGTTHEVLNGVEVAVAFGDDFKGGDVAA